MKSKLYLILLVGLLTVGCQDSVLNDIEDWNESQMSRSIEMSDNLSSPANDSGSLNTPVKKSKYTVTIRNSYYYPQFVMAAVHWEVLDMKYQPIPEVTMVNYSGLAYYDRTFEGYFEIEPGEYIIEAVAENLGHVEADCEIEAKNGGEIFFELVNDYQNAVWETPIFHSF